MTLALNEIRHTPITQLDAAQRCLLAASGFMRDIREYANQVKHSRWMQLEYERPHLRYLVGRLHGCCFAFSSSVIYSPAYAYYEELWELLDAMFNEAEFLTRAYLEPK